MQCLRWGYWAPGKLYLWSRETSNSHPLLAHANLFLIFTLIMQVKGQVRGNLEANIWCIWF